MIENQGICANATWRCCNFLLPYLKSNELLIKTKPFNRRKVETLIKVACVVIRQITVTYFIKEIIVLLRIVCALEFLFPNISASVLITH